MDEQNLGESWSVLGVNEWEALKMLSFQFLQFLYYYFSLLHSLAVRTTWWCTTSDATFALDLLCAHEFILSPSLFFCAIPLSFSIIYCKLLCWVLLLSGQIFHGEERRLICYANSQLSSFAFEFLEWGFICYLPWFQSFCWSLTGDRRHERFTCNNAIMSRICS